MSLRAADRLLDEEARMGDDIWDELLDIAIGCARGFALGLVVLVACAAAVAAWG